MLPKIQSKKLAYDHYPKLEGIANHDQNISKLKMIQQFLEEDSYTARPNLLKHRKQFSLHTYRHNNQEVLKKCTSNDSTQLHSNLKCLKKENMPPKKQSKNRPKTKRECIRLNQIIDITNRSNNEPLFFRKEVNLGNYKIL